MSVGVGEGTLGIVVWPAFVGLSCGAPSEGLHWEPSDLTYRRGQINWQLEDHDIVGRAKIHAPAGEFTHLLYFQHPEAPEAVGSVQLPHPIRFLTTGEIDVYPITNADLELLKRYNA